jgi:hypothetical protein
MMTGLTAKQKKALYVRVGFKGDPSSVRMMQRFRLNAGNVNRVFNCDVEFLQEDATGSIVWPKNWMSDCLPPPYMYNIQEKVWPELDVDALEESGYRGKVLVIADNVPEEVTAKALVVWVNTGLDDDDPDLASAKLQLAEMQENLDRVEKQIKELPSLKSAGGNAKDELEGKKKRAQALTMQKVDLEEDIRAVKHKFEELRKGREAMVDTAFSVRLAETRMPLRLNVWEIRFAKDNKGQRLSYVAAHKYNWSEFRLAVHRYTGAIMTGKNELPDKTGEYQEINMRNVTISRRRHGIGMFKFADERGLYSGHFRHGLRHGVGTEVNVQGRFQGRFDKDWRSGPGTQVCSNGDTIRCAYGGSRFHSRESLIFGDEYCDGLLHGHGRLRFVDGSVFDGTFNNGLPEGKGKLVSAAGAVLEGEFGAWCTLDGHGTWTAGEMTRIGNWRHGMMHGKGLEVDARLGTYEGDYARGEKNGFGKFESAVDATKGVYDGWFRNGFRGGRGSMNYGNVDRDAIAKATAKAAIRASMLAKSSRIGLGDEELDEADDEEGEEGDKPRPDASGDGAEEKKEGEVARVSEYQAMAGDVSELIPFRGDFNYEGRWRAGGVRHGGVFTHRFGRPEPNLHERFLTANGVNRWTPFLSNMPSQEEVILLNRVAETKRVNREVLDKRISKEAVTLESFAYWRRVAVTNTRDVKRVTRRGKSQLAAIKAAIIKPEREMAAEEDFGDEDDEEEEEDAQDVPDME